MTKSIGIALPGLARMAEVTRAMAQAAFSPGPAPEPMRLLTPWVLPAPGGGAALPLANRVAMAPMSTGLADELGHPTRATVAWYVARARGGTALVIVEPTLVSRPTGPRADRPLVLAADEDVEAFARLAEAVAGAGAAISLSLEHPDRRAFETISTADLGLALAAFGAAARRARDAGFRAIQLSLDAASFLGRSLARATNRRSDRYGRGPEGRRTLAREAVRIVAAVGLPVIVRIPCAAVDPVSIPVEDAASLGEAMCLAGATALEIAPGPTWDDGSLPLVAGNGEAVLTTQASAIGAAVAARGVMVPILASGRIVSALGAEAALRVPGVEAVAIGRALVADPAWTAKVRAGIESEIVPCIGCLACLDRDPGETIACVTNGDAGRESLALVPTETPRRMVVVGAGLPGLEFARVAATRGHDVTVVTGGMPLGGITGLRAGVPGNAEYGQAALAMVQRLRDLGVAMFEVPPDDIELVVDARPAAPLPVSWATGRNVLVAADVLGRDLHQMYGIGRRVATCGPGALAAEVGLFLAGWGRRVTVIVPGTLEAPFPDVHPMQAARLRERLLGYRCELLTGTVPVRWHDSRDRKSRLEVLRDGVPTVLGPFQTAVDCLGWPSEREPRGGSPAVTVGDAGTATALRRLVRGANDLARRV